jgi:hypothetical protein
MGKPPEDQEEITEPRDSAINAGSSNEGVLRQRFEGVFRDMPVDQRAAQARAASGEDLAALCFDPMPAVIQSVLENSHTNLTHARLIARHHRTGAGIEAVTMRAAFTADSAVRQELLRNPQLPAGALRRIWASRPMHEQWLATTSREIPEQNRKGAREVLRSRFTSGPAEEKVELIMRTEGRCLALLTGIPLDSKSTALLCRRTYASTLFIQNLARWSACPPPLLAQLMRQEIVKRNPQLREMLKRHPNAPSTI